MAQSWVSIANSALIKVGASRITSFDDEGKEAALCKSRYEDVRDTVLRMHPWNCAIKRVQLAPLSTAPAFDFGSQFQIPSDCLRIFKIAPEGDYRIEGRTILSDESVLDVKYIKQITDPTELDSLLSESIAYYLAHDIAYSLIQNESQRQNLYQAFEATLRRAKHIDSCEDGRQSLQANWFINQRNGGAFTPSDR